MTIHGIVFDIGGVLEITPPTGWVEKWEKRLNMKISEIDKRLVSMGKDGSLGTCSNKEWQDGLQEITGMDQVQIDEFMKDLWQEYLGTLNVELVDYFRNLRPKYQTVILSNSFVGAREKEEEHYHLSGICDFIIYSHEVGMAKPDPRIFTLTCERLGLQPSEVIFLDDHDEIMASARELGIHCIEYKDNAQAIADIEACIKSNI